MDPDTIKDKLKQAKDLTEGIDTELRATAYEVVLGALLSGTVPISQAQQQTTGGTKPVKDGGPADKVAAWLDTDIELAEELFEFGDSEAAVHIAHTSLPKKAADAQRFIALLKLAVDKIGYGVDEVSAKAILDLCDEHGCKDANIAKNIKASEFIVAKGGKRTMKIYKIRHSGLNKALEDARKIVGADVA